jgi:hypothetical protein
LKAINILEDIIDDKDLDAVQVLTKSIPNIRRGGQKTSFLPIYKYLSKIGIHSKADYDNNQLGINIPLFSQKDFQFYKFSPEDKQLSLSEAIEKYRGQEWKSIALIPYLSVREDEMDFLRDFIKLHFNKYLVTKSNRTTFMRKLICFYDWKRYGWHDTI